MEAERDPGLTDPGGRPPRQDSAEQLAAFLALIFSFHDEQTAVRRGLARVVEVLDAEVAALVRGGGVMAAVGFSEAEAPVADLVAVAGGQAASLTVPDVGECPAVSASLEGRQWALSLVVARRPALPFADDELALLSGMARVLTLGLRNLRLLENERTLRADSEHQANENARLLDALRERQVLLERLSQLQRGIVDQLPVHEVLEAVVEGACELLGDEVGVLRLVDPDDPARATLVAAVGAEDELLSERRRQDIGAGIGGRVMRERGLVVSDAVVGVGSAQAVADLPAAGVTAAMGAPVNEHGNVVGSLAVASRVEGREYGSREVTPGTTTDL